MKVLILDVVGVKFSPDQLDALNDLVSFINDMLKEKTEIVTITSKRSVPGPRWKWYLRSLTVSEEAAILKAVNRKIADIVAEYFEGKSGKIRATIREATESEKRETNNEEATLEVVPSPS